MSGARTGRTYRMLQEVVQRIETEQKSHIVVAYPDHISEMRNHLHKIMKEKGCNDIGNKITKFVTFSHFRDNRVDPSNGHMYGSAGINVYADHNVFESTSWWLYEQWLKWNKQKES